MPLGTEECSEKNLVKHGDLCCEPVFHCKPGTRVQSCFQNGGKANCVTCAPGLIQQNEVSSFDHGNWCFKAPKNNCSPGAVPSPDQSDLYSCPRMKCRCNVADCFYGNDPCICQRADRECSAEEQLNIETGECEQCPKWTRKPRAGCGPCIYSEDLWKARTSTAVYGTSTYPTPGQVRQISQPDDNNLTIVLPVLLSLSGLIVVAIVIALFLYRRRHRTSARNIQPNNTRGSASSVHHDGQREHVPLKPIVRNHQNLVMNSRVDASGSYSSLQSNGVNNFHRALSVENGGRPYVRVTGSDDGATLNVESGRWSKDDLAITITSCNREDSSDNGIGKPTAKVNPTPHANADPPLQGRPLQHVAPQVPVSCPVQPTRHQQMSSPNKPISSQHNLSHDSELTTPKCLRDPDSCSSLTDVKVTDNDITIPKYLASDNGNSLTQCKEVTSFADSGIDETSRLKVHSTANQDLADDLDEEQQEHSHLLEDGSDAESELSNTEDKNA